ncbi:MAG: glycosyltransferase family 4 protein [Thermotogota bacterium]|nr:glycosyltransferase family 4 protein [Thermotogota bacterium]
MKYSLDNVKAYETKGYNDPFNSSIVNAIRFAHRSYHISKSILKNEKIDIIHHFLPVTYPRIISFLPFNKSIIEKYPFVLGPISYPPYWPSKGFGKMIDYLSKPLFKKCIKEADILLVQTKHTRDLVKLINPEKEVIIISPGVDTSIFKPDASAVRELEVLTVGNLTPRKGMEYLIKAISIVKKDFPNILLRIIGTGPHEVYLKNLSSSLDLSHNVIFEGYTSQNYLIKCYKRATIFCSPSLVEPFGVVILEAMACGKPIVATKTEGAIEMIQNGKEGFLVDIADPKSIANILLTLFHHPELIELMGTNALKKTQRYYSWSSAAKIYNNIYKSVVGG